MQGEITVKDIEKGACMRELQSYVCSLCFSEIFYKKFSRARLNYFLLKMLVMCFTGLMIIKLNRGEGNKHKQLQ